MWNQNYKIEISRQNSEKLTCHFRKEPKGDEMIVRAHLERSRRSQISTPHGARKSNRLASWHEEERAFKQLASVEQATLPWSLISLSINACVLITPSVLFLIDIKKSKSFTVYEFLGNGVYNFFLLFWLLPVVSDLKVDASSRR